MATTGKFNVLANLNGGLSSRPSPLMVEASASQRMKSPSLLNCDFFTSGAVRKRTGKSIVGNSSSAMFSNLTSSVSTVFYNHDDDNVVQFDAPIYGMTLVSLSANTISRVVLSLASLSGVTAQACIFTKNAVSSSPDSLIANGLSNPVFIGTTKADYNFVFPIPPTVSTAQYYVGIVYTPSVNQDGTLNFITAYGDADGGGSNISFGGSVSGVLTFFPKKYDAHNLRLSVYDYSNTIIQGIYDYRFGSAQTQKQMRSSNGALEYNNAGTWTSLGGITNTGQDKLISWATLKNILFCAGDAGIYTWNGSGAIATLGARPSGTFARSALGGTVTTGTYKVMLVQTMTSGGYRSSLEYTVTTTAATDKIAVTAATIPAGPSWDYGTAATAVFMTTIGGSTYYKLASGSVSVGNPLPNGTTTFNITAPPAGTENTLLLEYLQEQAYFTSQAPTPTLRYMAAWQNFLVASGDANNPSRLWFSALGAPQIWSTYGGIGGNYLDLDTNDGEVITGIAVWNGNLYAFKRHKVFVINYTSVSSSPFTSRAISSSIGALGHWGIKDAGAKGLYFLSERGPAVCVGTYTFVVPSAAEILDRFNPSESSSYNITALSFSSAALHPTRSEIWWTVVSHSSTVRDRILIYDYETETFREYESQTNVLAEVSDANFARSLWSGGYSGDVYIHDSSVNDAGTSIPFYVDTPLLQFGSPFFRKVLQQVFVAGNVSTGILYCDVFLENSTTPSMTLQYDMSLADFKAGQSVTCGLIGRMFRLRLRNSDYDVPVEIDAFGLNFNVTDSQY